jgi:hypothetical protein
MRAGLETAAAAYAFLRIDGGDELRRPQTAAWQNY